MGAVTSANIESQMWKEAERELLNIAFIKLMKPY